jgi:hypothetical protein
MRALLASVFVVILVVAAVARSGDGHAAGAAHSSPASVHRKHHLVMRYTGSERLLIDSVDIAAGKAMQAANSPDGLFERRTSQEWCSMALDAESALVHHHSFSWAGKVDRARDAESRKFQLAARACG